MRENMRLFFVLTWTLLFVSSCGAVSPRPAVPVSSSFPLFTFVFDDGNETDYTIAREIFADEETVACAAITTDWIDTPNHLTAAQIIALRDAGWEIMSHTVSHPHLRSLTTAQIEDELFRSMTALEGLGVTIHNMVYPYNESDDHVRQIARKYYRSGRGGGSELNDAFIDPYNLRSFTGRQDLVKLERAVDRACAGKGWVIIYHHDIDAKITLTNKKGAFSRGEQLSFSPSGAQGRHVRDAWFLSAGFMHVVPLAGTPQPGDSIIGQASGASALLSHVAFNDREMIKELLRYVRTKHPDMKIVTIDQALDMLGIPKHDARSHE